MTILCRWCNREIVKNQYNVWVHVDASWAKMVSACDPDMQSCLAAPPEPELVEQDAWKQADDLRKRFTKTWEIRSDLEVTALGTWRKVRLRVDDEITTRNVSTMRELGEALLAACDFVEKSNPEWASHTPFTITRIQDGTQ